MEQKGLKTSQELDNEINATLDTVDIMEKEDLVESYKELASDAIMQSIALGCLISEFDANYGEEIASKHLNKALENADDVISIMNGEKLDIKEDEEDVIHDLFEQ